MCKCLYVYTQRKTFLQTLTVLWEFCTRKSFQKTHWQKVTLFMGSSPHLLAVESNYSTAGPNLRFFHYTSLFLLHEFFSSFMPLLLLLHNVYIVKLKGRALKRTLEETLFLYILCSWIYLNWQSWSLGMEHSKGKKSFTTLISFVVLNFFLVRE